jgi:hypothetical protein
MRQARRPVVMFVLAGLLVAHPAAAEAPVDQRLSKGVGQVDEGDYDGAIVTLDVLVRELAGTPGRSSDLAQAYLYLGVAYLAKGHETSAKARFREALTQAGDLRLTTDKFAPRVVELFEKAREESRREVPPPAPPKGGRSKALPILLGIGVLGGGAAALAAGGGGGDGTTGSDPSVTTPPLNFTGQLGARAESTSVPVGPFRPGTCEASLNWSDARTEVRMFVVPLGASPPQIETRNVSSTSSVANWTCVSGIGYRIDLFLQEPHIEVSYQLRVVPPQ